MRQDCLGGVGEKGRCAAAREGVRAEAWRQHGPLAALPILVAGSGSSVRGRRFRGHIDGQYRHVRIQYRARQPLGLPARFDETLKHEEMD